MTHLMFFLLSIVTLDHMIVSHVRWQLWGELFTELSTRHIAAGFIIVQGNLSTSCREACESYII